MNKSQHIIETSHQLFYQHGFHACGVEQLAASAGVTKRTLYRYFPSKDALIMAVLDYRHQLFMARLKAALSQYEAQDTAKGYLQFLNDWIASPDFYGCMFINACAEYSDHRHPLHRRAAAHKQAVYQLLLERLQTVNPAKAEAAADCLFLGGEGLIVSAQTDSTLLQANHSERVREMVEGVIQEGKM